MLNKSFFVIIMLTLALPFGGVGGSMLHAQGNDPVLAGKRAEATGKDDAAGGNRPYLDYRGGKCYDRPSEGVQQVP